MNKGKNKKRILIIEDESDVAQVMKTMLEMEGYKADVALDPREGIKKIKKYDLLLLDIMMPIMSGREVLAELKKQGINIPVIVVTAVGMPMEVEMELSRKYPGIKVISKVYIERDLIKEVAKKIKK